MALATQITPDEITGVAQQALDHNGARSTSHTTNVLFEYLTGVDTYALPDILFNSAPIESSVGAKHLRKGLASLLGSRLADASALLGHSESRFSRNDSIDPEMLDRAHAILDTYSRVAATLGPTSASEWFNTPNAALDNTTPTELLKASYGRRLVHDLIDALHAGSYV